jgi:hypothetical protein
MHWVIVLAGLLALHPRNPSCERYETGPAVNGLVDASLSICSDGSYTYLSQTGSCWVDWNDRGRWLEQEDGLLVLTSDDARRLSSVSVTLLDGSDEHLLIKVVNEHETPIQGVVIRLGDGSFEKRTDLYGNVRFEAGELQHVVGSSEWATYVAEEGSGFVQLRRGSWRFSFGSLADQPSRTYFIRTGDGVRELGGLDLVFTRCP